MLAVTLASYQASRPVREGSTGALVEAHAAAAEDEASDTGGRFAGRSGTLDNGSCQCDSTGTVATAASRDRPKIIGSGRMRYLQRHRSALNRGDTVDVEGQDIASGDCSRPAR